MAIGRVKWFSPQKGFGFIRPSDGGDDIFVHMNAVKSSGLIDLTEGMDVEYEVEVGRQGRPSAGRIEVI